MRKLQSVLMVLAVLCFAVPAFAAGDGSTIDLAPIGIGLASPSQPVSAAWARARPSPRLPSRLPATPAPRPAFSSC